MPASHHLPIWQLEQPILRSLQSSNRLVLIAPTGSGKTTQVPQMLLDAATSADPILHSAFPTPHSGKVVILQPRRVAARTVAARVAYERNVRLGGEVGYQIRFDDHTSLGTRICFVTEGILLRWLQDDPTLSDISAVLFDEFHERNLLSDVALALVKQLQQSRRPDLKIIVMSATLEAEPVAKYLGGESACPILVSEGRSFPVQIMYQPIPDGRPITDQAADAVDDILRSGESGDILIFMAGMGEINSTIAACRSLRTTERLAFIPLHGDLPPDEQDLAFSPNPLRKVVVATNVAETSVTIDGITHVVDGGEARVARYDAERGIGTLFIEKISRASAEQRAGRAGRTAPGTCHRLWTEGGHLNRPERNTPEIQRSDLAETVLLLHSLHVHRAADFDWLDKPDPAAVERAERLLRTLGALDAEGELTSVGRRMLRLPMHPRYSRMLVEASRRGCVPSAALCAALVSGRDLLARLGRDDKHISEARELFEASAESDFYTLMRAWQFAKNNQFNVERCRRYGVHAAIARQVEQTFEQLLSVAGKELKEDGGWKMEDGGNPEPVGDPAALPRCLLAGFADQLARRRDQGTLECDLTEGRTGTLMRESVVQNSNLFVTANIRETASRGTNLTLLGLATAVKREWIEEMFADQVPVTIEHLYDRTHKRVSAVKLVRFHGLVIHHEHQAEIDPAASGRCLAGAFLSQYFELPLLNHEVKQWIARVNLVHTVMPELDLPAFDASAIRECLSKAFAGLTLAKEAQATHLRDHFIAHFGADRVSWINELAPVSIPWLDRSIKLTYATEAVDEDGQPTAPEIQVKINECFKLTAHPRICENRLPIRLLVSAPDNKRLDTTTDWPSFRNLTYPKLKPTLQKKYPGSMWP